jgi:hypothetical protein
VLTLPKFKNFWFGRNIGACGTPSALELHYLIHEVDAREHHAAAAIALQAQRVQHLLRILSLRDALLELLVLIAEQFTACPAPDRSYKITRSIIME